MKSVNGLNNRADLSGSVVQVMFSLPHAAKSIKLLVTWFTMPNGIKNPGKIFYTSE